MLLLFSPALDAQGKKNICMYIYKNVNILLPCVKTLKCVIQTQNWRDLSHFCQRSQLGNFTQTFCIFSVENCLFILFIWLCPITLTAQFLAHFILILSFIFLLILRKIPFILPNSNWRLPKTHQQETFFLMELRQLPHTMEQLTNKLICFPAMVEISIRNTC